jgi:hypothetical protein
MMALGSVRAAPRGLRDKASEPDASACFVTVSLLPGPRLFINWKPTPLLSHAYGYAPIVHIQAIIAASAIYLASRRRARLALGEHNTPGVPRRDVTPQVVWS